jgi:hypothetical protein
LVLFSCPGELKCEKCRRSGGMTGWFALGVLGLVEVGATWNEVAGAQCRWIKTDDPCGALRQRSNNERGKKVRE